MSRICLLVGNGFSVDLVKSLDLNLNSSLPISSFGNNNITFDEFINKLPSIRDSLLPLVKEEEDQFAAISRFIEEGKALGESTFERRECDLRRFLALAYSKFQLEIDKINYSNWEWTKWLYRNKKNLACAISFNYDLVLEKAIRLARINKGYKRIGVINEQGGIPIIKPHGSIDFEIPERFITFGSEEGVWDSMLARNDIGYVEKVTYDNWSKARIQPDIIPPSQINYHRDITWVKDCFLSYPTITKTNGIDTFVIVGHSYSKVDQDEINEFIDNLDRKTEFYIVNPHYEEENIQKLISYIETCGHSVAELRKFGPPRIKERKSPIISYK